MATAPVSDRRTVVVDHYGPRGRSAWMDVDWREHQRWVRVEGRWMNVIDVGPGAPEGTIVFIHGLSGAWMNWLENIPHFAQTHRVIAMDLPGFGASEMPAEKISIKGYARTVDALLQQLGVERAVVIGNSMGGFIGIEIALSYSTWVDRLVLVSAAGLTIEHQRNDHVLALMRRTENILAMYTGWLASKSEVLTRRPRSRAALLKIVTARPEKLPGPLTAEMLKGSGKPGFIDALDALTSYPIRDRLGDINVPTLVVWGEDDVLVPVRDAWEFGKLIPASRVVVYEDTGHMAMLERPEAFNALVDDFLEE